MGGIFSIAGTVVDWILRLALLAGFHYLWALPLYRVAGGRKLRAAWLGWVPVLSVFLLFAIADSIYRRRRKRAQLLVRALIGTGVWVLAQARYWVILPVGPYSFLSLLGLAAGIFFVVLLHMALYRFYTEYKWQYAVTFTVLGIFMPFAVPIFLFACRGERPRSAW